jgi:hypothetical protein
MKLVNAIQRRAAVVAIGPSTVRGQLVPGVVNAAREFLDALGLNRFATADAQKFRAELDRATDEMRAALPKGARAWGLARKCLNIFLRDAFYNHYLRESVRIDRATKFYEVPLDRIVAKALRQKSEVRLPRWPGVKHLKPELSDEYQQAAAALSMRMQIERVHLDTYLWVDGR